LGEVIGKEVVDSNIHCLSENGHDELNGSENCWAYWLEGQQIENHDVYLWISLEYFSSADCTAGEGPEFCAIEREISCNNSKMERLGLETGGELICVPTFVLENK